MRGASLNCQVATALMLRAVATEDEAQRDAVLGKLRDLTTTFQAETVQWDKNVASQPKGFHSKDCLLTLDFKLVHMKT